MRIHNHPPLLYLASFRQFDLIWINEALSLRCFVSKNNGGVNGGEGLIMPNILAGVINYSIIY